MKNNLLEFHIGRGGRFNNGGHKTFRGFGRTISETLPSSATFLPMNFEAEEDMLMELWRNEDWEDEYLKSFQEQLGLSDEEFREKKVDLLGGESLKYFEDEGGTGFINYDHQYDTVIVKKLEDCDEEELLIMIKDQTKNGFNSYELDQILDDLIESSKDSGYEEVIEILGVESSY